MSNKRLIQVRKARLLIYQSKKRKVTTALKWIKDVCRKIMKTFGDLVDKIRKAMTRALTKAQPAAPRSDKGLTKNHVMLIPVPQSPQQSWVERMWNQNGGGEK